MKEISRFVYKRGDLLHEFPAETRLTVYRRLDMVKLARLRLAKNGTTSKKFSRNINVLVNHLEKSAQKTC